MRPLSDSDECYLNDLVIEMETLGVLEDRREYCVEDHMETYGLTRQMAEHLYALVQARFQ